MESDGEQGVDHGDVALHRDRDGQVHGHHQARLFDKVLLEWTEWIHGHAWIYCKSCDT